MKRPQNTQANIDMHFPCHNHGHLEEKQLFQGNLASYFVSLNLFSIRAVFLKHPVATLSGLLIRAWHSSDSACYTNWYDDWWCVDMKYYQSIEVVGSWPQQQKNYWIWIHVLRKYLKDTIFIIKLLLISFLKTIYMFIKITAGLRE